MLKSVANQHEKILEILTDVDESSRMENYSIIKVQQLITFLEPFKECIQILEAEKTPMLHLVLLWLKKLIQHCSTNISDNSETQHPKNATKTYLETKFKLHKYHKIATFLVPTFRKLRMLSAEEKTIVFENVKGLISHIQNTTHQSTSTSTASPSTSTESTSEEQPPEKRLRTTFSEWADSDGEIEESCDFTLYMSLKYTANEDILQWWKNNAQILPQLSIIAKQIFAVPASSAPSERCFSSAGFIIQERRSCLKPEIVDAILFLHNNM